MVFHGIPWSTWHDFSSVPIFDSSDYVSWQVFAAMESSGKKAEKNLAAREECRHSNSQKPCYFKTSKQQSCLPQQIDILGKKW